MPRKLVTVRQVAAVRPIPGADRIEAVAVDGWTCVAGAGEFRAGDLAVFFEIDSFLPAEDPRWAYLQDKFTTMTTTGAATARVATEETALVTREGFRVKSAKLRGQVSQGILETLDEFPEVAAAVAQAKSEAEAELEEEQAKHDDNAARQLLMRRLSEMSFDAPLGVTKFEKYEPPAAGGGDGKEKQFGSNNNNNNNNNNVPMPDFIPRTDQERVQNLPADAFGRWADAVFQETVKMDGSSMTVYFVRNDSPWAERLPPLPAPSSGSGEGEEARAGKITRHRQQQQPNGRVGVCSRNLEKPEPSNQGPGAGGSRSPCHFWATAHQNGLPAKLAALGRNVAVQGELCGSSIQQNFEGFPAGCHEFFAFAVWDIDARRYVRPREAEDLIVRVLGLRHVPVVGYAQLGEIVAAERERAGIGAGVGTEVGPRELLVRRAEGRGWNGRKREGIVLKHAEGGLSFKAISNSYLLKHGE